MIGADVEIMTVQDFEDDCLHRFALSTIDGDSHFDVHTSETFYHHYVKDAMEKILQGVPKDCAFWHENPKTILTKDFFRVFLNDDFTYRLSDVAVKKERCQINGAGAWFHREATIVCEYKPRVKRLDRMVQGYCICFSCDCKTSMRDCLHMLSDSLQLERTDFLETMLRRYENRYARYKDYRWLV